MYITHEADYAIRILRALSDHQRHTVKELCQSQNVPHQFANRIVGKFVEAGVLKSARGVKGGCELIKPLSEITLYDVVRIVDPSRTIAECVREGVCCTPASGAASCCNVHKHLCRIQNLLDAEMKRYTIQEMLLAPNDL